LDFSKFFKEKYVHIGTPTPHQNLTMPSLGVEQTHKVQKKNLKRKHMLPKTKQPIIEKEK